MQVPIKSTSGSYPFKQHADRFSYLYNKDPNFSLPKKSHDIKDKQNEDIKIQGQLPVDVINKMPAFQHLAVRKAMGHVKQAHLREESEMLQQDPKSSFNTKSNLQNFSPLKTKFVFVQPREQTLE